MLYWVAGESKVCVLQVKCVNTGNNVSSFLPITAATRVLLRAAVNNEANHPLCLLTNGYPYTSEIEEGADKAAASFGERRAAPPYAPENVSTTSSNILQPNHHRGLPSVTRQSVSARQQTCKHTQRTGKRQLERERARATFANGLIDKAVYLVRPSDPPPSPPNAARLQLVHVDGECSEFLWLIGKLGTIILCHVDVQISKEWIGSIVDLGIGIGCKSGGARVGQPRWMSGGTRQPISEFVAVCSMGQYSNER